jgi:hypothetical protein
VNITFYEQKFDVYHQIRKIHAGMLWFNEQNVNYRVDMKAAICGNGSKLYNRMSNRNMVSVIESTTLASMLRKTTIELRAELADSRSAARTLIASTHYFSFQKIMNEFVQSTIMDVFYVKNRWEQISLSN